MKSILFIAATLFCFFAVAQKNTWKIYHNNKLLINTGEESEEKNVCAITKTQLDKKGSLMVIYEEGKPDIEWKRTIAFLDDKSNIIFEKNEVSKIQVPNAELKKFFKGKVRIKIYTWAIPKDPAKAALVRIRRIHLCTLLMK